MNYYKYGAVPYNKPYLTEKEELSQREYLNQASGGTGGTSDATEATQLAILAELQDDDRIAEILVTDSANVTHIRRTTVDADTGVITTQYLDPQTNTVSTPTFPIVGSADGTPTEYEEIIVEVAPGTTGTIPSGTVAYAVQNLGTAPSTPIDVTTLQPFTFDGQTIPSYVATIESAPLEDNEFYGAIPYDSLTTNILIKYTIPV